MKFTNEQLTKAKEAKSVEELLAFAKENGIELAEEEAKKYFAELHNEGELADDELSNVAGGCDDTPDPKYHAGQKVLFNNDGVDNYGIIMSSNYVELQKAWYYLIHFDNGKEIKFPLESAICPVKVIG